MIPDGEAPIAEVVGANVRRLFESSGKSATAITFELIKSSNLEYFYDLMDGKRNITIRTLQKLAYIFGVSTVELLKGVRE
ncbi:hypothetical protein [Enterococcus olivae]